MIHQLCFLICVFFPTGTYTGMVLTCHKLNWHGFLADGRQLRIMCPRVDSDSVGNYRNSSDIDHRSLVAATFAH